MSKFQFQILDFRTGLNQTAAQKAGSVLSMIKIHGDRHDRKERAITSAAAITAYANLS